MKAQVGDKRLYIISGCNGAGKTTASFNILPDILSCKEFVNADEIARGISPFQPEKVAVAAGRLMLNRVSELMNAGEDFAFETALKPILVYEAEKGIDEVVHNENKWFNIKRYLQ